MNLNGICCGHLHFFSILHKSKVRAKLLNFCLFSFSSQRRCKNRHANEKIENAKMCKIHAQTVAILLLANCKLERICAGGLATCGKLLWPVTLITDTVTPAKTCEMQLPGQTSIHVKTISSGTPRA
jgi:hypothetical protein